MPAPAFPLARSPRGARTDRGAAAPSPVVALSVVAVAMAGLAWVATRNPEPTEREITQVATQERPSVAPTLEPVKKPKPAEPQVKRGTVMVEVYNNSSVTGLATRVASRADEAGWQVVGADNWYGTIPATTVYYPPKLERAAKTLALDLGVRRTAPAVEPMRLDRLTLILTGPLD